MQKGDEKKVRKSKSLNKAMAFFLSMSMAATMTVGVPFTAIEVKAEGVEAVAAESIAEGTTIDLTTWEMEGTNYTQGGGTLVCNSIAQGDAFLLNTATGKDFTYEADVQFNEPKGAASLIFRSNGETGDTKQMYVANINGETGEMRLFKFYGNGASDIATEIITPNEDGSYHLKVVTSGNQITYTISDSNETVLQTLTATDDMMGEGQFGLLTWEANVTYSNITATATTTIEGSEITSEGLTWRASGDYTLDTTQKSISCNSIDKGDSFLLSETTGNNFVYETDVQFHERRGAASLVIRSNGNTTSGQERGMYVANINGENGEVKLFKFEDGRDVNLFAIQKVNLTDNNTYHLKVVAIGAHMVYYINDQLVVNTGDFTMGNDSNDDAAAILGGQNDVLDEGQFGLLTWNANVTYSNMKKTDIKAENTPQLSGLTATANGGEIERPIVFDEDQYVYFAYVTNSTTSIALNAAKKNDATEITATNEAGEVVDINALPVTKDKQVYTLTAKNGEAEVLYRVRVNKMQPDEEYYNEDYRGQFHYSVKDGWGNDPNGMVYDPDTKTYHFFYQFYDKAVWGPMHWMHATSTDLIHWTEDTIVFYPDEYGTMFSGCAVLADHTTAPDIFAEGEKGIVFLITVDGGAEGQKIIGAYSKDGCQTFHKYRNGKALMHWKQDSLQNGAFRDPKVFRYENKWFMAIAGGPLRIYSSDDLVNWKEESAYGDLHTECPEIYPLPVVNESGKETGEYKWVLNRGGRKYKIGDFRQVDGKWAFVPDEQYASTNANGMGNEDRDGIMNFGPDSYAAMTYYIQDFGTKQNMTVPDLIEINWMNTWEGNFCKSIPYANGNFVFNGTYNLQCKLGVRQDADGKYYLTQTPIKEYETLRETTGTVTEQNVTVNDNESKTLTVDGTEEVFEGDSYEIVANIKPGQDVTETGFKVRVGNGEETVVKYDVVNEELVLDRSQSGTIIVQGGINVRGQKVTRNADGSIDLHIYVDRSSVEVFSKDYTVAGAMQIFPSIASRGLQVYSVGGTSTADIMVYPLTSIWTGKAAAPAGIRLNKSSYNGYVGDTFTLNTTIVPIGTEGSVTYSVDDNSVVSLAQSGNSVEVTALKAGTATITATLNGTELTKTCTVTVRENNFKTNLTGFTPKGGEWYIDSESYCGKSNDNAFLFSDNIKDGKFTYKVDAIAKSGILNFIFRSQGENVWNGSNAVQLNLGNGNVRLFDFKGDKTLAETGDSALKVAEDNKYHVEIQVDGQKVVVTVNGTKYLETEITSRENMYTEGLVALGFYNSDVQYQNLYVVSAENPIAGTSVSLKGDIALNFFADLSDDPTADVSMTFELPNGTISTMTKDQAIQQTGTDGKTYYVFSCDVAAKEMNDTITATMKIGDNSKAYEYSVKEYADYIIAHQEEAAYAKVAPLVKAMLNYGGNAQQYFGHNINSLANANLTDEEKSLADVTKETVKDYIATKTEAIDGIAYYGTSTILETTTSIRHYFKLADGRSIDEFTFKCGETKLEPTAKNGMYYVEIKDISAKNLIQDYTVSVANTSDTTKTQSITYSVYSYINAILNKENSKMQDTAKAMYKYGEAAKTYADNTTTA